MPGESYLFIQCGCGHEVNYWRHEVPASFQMDETTGWITPETWARFRCSKCGRRGRPPTTISGWGHPGGDLIASAYRGMFPKGTS